MIKVTNLTKVYKSRKKERCVALNNVSFTLDDKGFVFVIGKSGSGKTTLLSLIGGLDNMTSGDVCVNGHKLSDYKNNDYSSYRNTVVGYVFQDFHLIDELTIYENISIVLELQQKKNPDAVKKVLEDVGLSGFENRYPKELSGGEKQRVAIARALVKKPDVILADEPTGNLDTKTTKQILDLLKELSKTRPVMIVSHNLSDAHVYADRILELSQGIIINDYIRNPEYSENVNIKCGELFIPVHKKMSKEEELEVNDKLSKGEIKKIKQIDNAFIQNENHENSVDVEEKSLELKKTNFSLKSLIRLASTFLKKDIFRLSIYSFIVASLVVILGLCELIVVFDSSSIVETELKDINQNIISLKKENYVDSNMNIDKNCVINVTENDIRSFIDNGYDGSLYELVFTPLDYGPKSTFAHKQIINSYSPSDLYYNGTRGTLIANEEYLEKVFGTVEYLALANEIRDYGIYITDYSADAIIYYAPTRFPSYQSILGANRSMGNNVYAYVNGIIKTNYKERYADLMAQLANVENSKEDILEIVSSEEYRAYYDDVIQNLSISYTANPNFKEDFLESQIKTWVPIGNSLFVYNGKEYEWDGYAENSSKRSNYNLNKNEIVMNYSIYNSIFNTNYSSSTINAFIPHDVTFKFYHYYDIDHANVVMSKDVKIVALNNSATYFSEDLFCETAKLNLITTELYFDDLSDVSKLFDIGEGLGYIPNSFVALSLITMTKAVDVFKGFFNIIFIGLCSCSFFIIANYGLKLIKERKYELGIMKAIGTRNLDLSLIFGSQVLLLAIFIVILYILGSYVFIDFSNDILIKSLIELAPNNFIIDLDILYINNFYLCLNIILIIVIVFVSFIIPIMRLRKLKPTNIIKAKE